MTINDITDASAAPRRHPATDGTSDRTSGNAIPRSNLETRGRSRRPSHKIAFLVIGALAALSACSADDPQSASSAPMNQATTASQVDDQPRASDTAVIDAYFVAYNDGDTDAVLSILAPNPIYDETYDGGRPDPNGGEPIDRAELEAVLAWNHAQGEILTDPDCRLADEQSREGTTLECTYSTLDAVVQAVDGRPIPTRSLFTIRGGAITELRFGYGFPDFATLGRPFNQWLERHHPDVEGADCCAGDTRAESIQRGALRAEWAREWNRYLEQNGCAPIGPCTSVLEEATSEGAPQVGVPATATKAIELATENLMGPRAVAAFTTVSAAFESFNSGDAEGWVIPVSAELDPDPDVGVDDFLERTRAQHVAGARLENGSCDYEELSADPPPSNEDIDGPVARHQFTCSATYADAFTIAAGIDAVEEYEFFVADDGTPVETFNSGQDLQLRQLMRNFVDWLEGDHPDLAASLNTNAPPIYPLTDDVPEVLSLLDEFIAASDRWPLTSE